MAVINIQPLSIYLVCRRSSGKQFSATATVISVRVVKYKRRALKILDEIYLHAVEHPGGMGIDQNNDAVAVEFEVAVINR